MGIRGIYNVLRFNEVFIKSSKMVSSLSNKYSQPVFHLFWNVLNESVKMLVCFACMCVCVRVHMYVIYTYIYIHME